MVFPQVIAGFHALINVIGLPMNLLVMVTVALEKRFHVMRYILLASLAVSDFLYLLLANSFRIGSIAQERWLYGQTMCHLNPFFMLYFYLNTVLHLIAISYESYSAIVKSPLTYNGTITKRRVVLMIFIWVAPIPLSIGPFVGWGQYVYNPEVFYCEQAWGIQNDKSVAMKIAVFFIVTNVVPFLILVFLNWSVVKTVQALQHNEVLVGTLDVSEMSESQAQEMARRRSERKAAVVVCIIVAAFVVCFLPAWIVGFCRRLLNVPAEVIHVTNTIFFMGALCNPIIYSILKRDFRAGVMKVFRRMGVHCGNLDDDDDDDNNNNNNNNQIGMNNITEASTARPAAPQATQNQDNQIISVRANIGTEESTARPVTQQEVHYQDGGFHRSTRPAKVALQISRLSPIQEISE